MNPICPVGMIFPSACQERESPVTHGNLCLEEGGSAQGIIFSWCIPAPAPGCTQGLFFMKIPPCWADTQPAEQQWCGCQGGLDLPHQGLGMSVAMEARAEGGGKPGTCQEGGGEWLCDRLVELHFFLF